MDKNTVVDLLKKVKPFYLTKLTSSFFTQFGSLFLIYMLNPSQLGHLSLIISVAQLMFVFTSGWSNGAVINLGSKQFSESGSYKSIIYYRGLIVLVSFIVVTIFFLIFKGSISAFILNGDNYWLVYVLFLGYVFYDFSSQLLYPGNKDLIQSVAELIATFVVLSLTLVVVHSVKDYVYVYTSVFFIFSFSVINLFSYFYRDQKLKWSNAEFCFVFKYSVWQILSVVGIYIINIGINYVLVFNKTSAEDIGLYNFAYKLFAGFSPFFALFGIVIPKWIYSFEKDKLHKELKKRLLYCVCILTLLYFFISIILKPFIIMVGKEDYLKSADFFLYLLPAFVFMSYGNLMNTVLMNTKFFKQAQFAIVFQGCSLVIFSFPLVHFFGINGALIATSLSFVLGALYLYVLYNKRVKQSFALHLN